MAEVVFDGVGTPVQDPNIVGAEVNLTFGPVISDNANSPKEADFGSTGAPVQEPEIVGAEVNLIPGNTIFRDSTLGSVGVPVGDGNQPGFPVTFDNQGKNVTVAPMAVAAIDTFTTVQLFSPPLNFNP